MVVAAIVAFAAVAAVFPWPLASYRRSEASPSSPGGTGCLCEKASCRKQTTKDCTYSTLYRALFKVLFWESTVLSLLNARVSWQIGSQRDSQKPEGTHNMSAWYSHSGMSSYMSGKGGMTASGRELM